MNKRVKVYMGIPSTGTRSDAQMYVLREIEETYKDTIELVYPEICIHRIFHDFARNAIVEEFLDSDCDVLWFLDSDIAPSKHILDLIAIHYDKWKVAGGVYPVFVSRSQETNEPAIVFTVYKGSPEGKKGLYPSRIPYSGTEFVDGLATGCLFIKREVFAQLEKPYFEFKFKNESRELIEGEDLGFCFKLRALGIQFFTDYSMVCKHYKQVDLLDMNNYTISFTNTAILAYDADIRAKVTAAVQAAYQAGKESAQKIAPASTLILPEQFSQRKSGGLVVPPGRNG